MRDSERAKAAAELSSSLMTSAAFPLRSDERGSETVTSEGVSRRINCGGVSENNPVGLLPCNERNSPIASAPLVPDSSTSHPGVLSAISSRQGPTGENAVADRHCFHWCPVAESTAQGAFNYGENLRQQGSDPPQQLSLSTAPPASEQRVMRASSSPPPPPSASWFHRTFRPLRPGSIRSSIFALASTALGAGVLTTPYAMSQAGLVLGVSLLLLDAVVCFLTTFVLTDSVHLFKCSTYSTLADRLVGSWLGIAVDTMVSVNGFGVSATLMVFLADFLPADVITVWDALVGGATTAPPLAAASGGECIPRLHAVPPSLTNRALLLSVAVICVWPLAIRKNISGLRYATLVPVLALSATVILVLIDAPRLYQLNHSPTNPVHLATFSWNSFKTFNIFLFAFMQHVNVCMISHEMSNPTNVRVLKILSRSILLEFLLYLCISVGGYLSWLGYTRQNFVNNYPLQDSLFKLCRIGLTLSMLIAIPVNNIAAGRSMVSVYSRIRRGWRRRLNNGCLSPSRREPLLPAMPIRGPCRDEQELHRVVGPANVNSDGYMDAILSALSRAQKEEEEENLSSVDAALGCSEVGGMGGLMSANDSSGNSSSSGGRSLSRRSLVLHASSTVLPDVIAALARDGHEAPLTGQSAASAFGNVRETELSDGSTQSDKTEQQQQSRRLCSGGIHRVCSATTDDRQQSCDEGERPMDCNRTGEDDDNDDDVCMYVICERSFGDSGSFVDEDTELPDGYPWRHSGRLSFGSRAPETAGPRVAAVTSCLLISYVFALSTNKVADIVGLVGGLVSTCLMCLFPALIYYKGLGQLHRKSWRLSVTVFLLTVSAIGFFSSVVIILQFTGLCFLVPSSTRSY